MGKQDITQMKFFRDTKRFADIWNGLAFNGRQVVKWDELEEIRPVSTLVLYWNSDPWDGAKSLHELVDFTSCEEMREITADYKLNIVNLDTIQNGDELFQNRDVKDVVNLYQKRNDKIAFKEYIDTQKIFDRESIEVVTEMVTSKELKEYMQSNKDNKGGNLDMCKAITDLIEDGRAEGKNKKGIEVFINCINRKMSKEEAQAIANISDELVEKAYNMMSEVLQTT